MTDLKVTEANLRGALRRLSLAETATKRALRRTAVLEQTLVEVWLWTNNGHPDLELLLPILKRADETPLITALDQLERTKA